MGLGPASRWGGPAVGTDRFIYVRGFCLSSARHGPESPENTAGARWKMRRVRIPTLVFGEHQTESKKTLGRALSCFAPEPPPASGVGWGGQWSRIHGNTAGAEWEIRQAMVQNPRKNTAGGSVGDETGPIAK